MAQITMSQVRNSYVTLLEAQKTATPTLLRKVERFRPGAVHEAPVAWVGDQVEDITYDQGTRTRTIRTEVVIAAPYPTDDITTADPFDELQDAIRERLTNAYNAIANTLMELIQVESGEVPFAGAERTTAYRSLTLTVRHRIWEGRI